MSLILLLVFIVAVVTGKLRLIDNQYYVVWALFAFVDAVWFRVLWGIVYGG